MIGRLSQCCPTCHRTTYLLAGEARWSCDCGITYTAHVEDGLVSVYWSKEGKSDLLFAVRVKVSFPAHEKMAAALRGRRKPASSA